VLIPAAALVILLCHPTVKSFVPGLLVAVLGEGLRIWGVGYSGTTTRESRVIAPQLVTAGPYGYVRNPLYLGNFITALGFLIVGAGGIGWVMRLLLGSIIVLSYVTVYGLIIPLEEEYLARTFGPIYSEYKRAVPRLVPRLTPYPRSQGTFDWRVIKTAEIHTLILFTLMGCMMLAKLILEYVSALLLHG
jgi:protein-S-isoprenylcysteine O-methyltransferase Ste14